MMSFVSEWFETAKSVTKSPSEALRSESRMDAFGYPLKFAVFSVFLASILNTASVALRASTNPLLTLEPVTLVTSFVGAVVVGPIGLAVLAGVIHVFAYLLGARGGYSKTFAAVCYGTAVAPLAAVFTLLSAVVPLAGLVSALVGLWALQIQYRGLQHFHDISPTRAGLAVILPIVIVLVVVLGSLFMAMAAFASVM